MAELRRKFVGKTPEVVEWVKSQLGIDPALVSHLTIEIDAFGAATVTAVMYLREADLAALKIDEVEETGGR